MSKKFVVPKKVPLKKSSEVTYIRVPLEDRKKIKKISDETGESMQAIIRRAIRFALESM